MHKLFAIVPELNMELQHKGCNYILNKLQMQTTSGPSGTTPVTVAPPILVDLSEGLLYYRVFKSDNVQL